MVSVRRSHGNPILSPNKKNTWESRAVFNPCPIRQKETTHMMYRAIGDDGRSIIGHAISHDGLHFTNRRQCVVPQYDWEQFGCEDPRVVKIEEKFYIFYTALSTFPFTPEGIRVGVAVTQDFHTIEEKHLVTPFNAKAMAWFGEKINGKYAVILTAHTDKPPAEIAIASVDEIADLWSQSYWEKWYAQREEHRIPLQRKQNDHIEVGAPPIKTPDGWVLIYCYIHDYLGNDRVFVVEAVLLDTKDPRRVLGRYTTPLLVPETAYERHGEVPNIVFPSGALVEGDVLALYYGAADTTCCVAYVDWKELQNELCFHAKAKTKIVDDTFVSLTRSENNPILSPKPYHTFESKAVFNAAALYENKNVHIVYRAMGRDDTSYLGYARSPDGISISYRSEEPIYLPRESFELKHREGNSGCEDPRLTRIDNRVYMCYTAFDGIGPTRVALSSIALSDFLKNDWKWEKPLLISPPRVNDKNACLLSEKVERSFVFLHRLHASIWIDFIDDLSFRENGYIRGTVLMEPREESWDSEKIGIAGPPIKTPYGWVLIYHGLSKHDRKYRLGAALLHARHPDHVVSRLHEPILEPVEKYEDTAIRPGTVFSCAAVVIADVLYVYYGASDTYLCVATVRMREIVGALKTEESSAR